MDESLRAMSRAVEAGEGAGARLRYARALERAGRRDEAFDALASGREDPDVRAELARFPLWRQTDADAGRTRFLDVAPIRREPRVKWVSEAIGALGRTISAGPNRIACEDDRGATKILDADTGEVRREFTYGEPCAFVGDTLLMKRKTKLRGYDLETGAALWEETTWQLSYEALHVGEILVTASPVTVSAYRLAHPRKQPKGLWDYRVRGTNRKGRFAKVALADDTALVPHEGEIAALDLADGHVRSRFAGNEVLADEAGFVVVEERRLVVRDAEHRVVWALTERGQLLRALTPGVVVVRVPSIGSAIFDRATGDVVHVVVGDGCERALVARDVMYALNVGEARGRDDDRLRAFTTTGEDLWAISLGNRVGGGRIVSLFAGSRRLFGTTSDGRAFCLEEAPPAS
jgi:hypothetical protein